MRANLRDLAEAAAHDPAQAIWDAVGDLGDYEPFHNRLLCATYVPPNKVITRDDGVKVEIHRADRSLMEERFQGKAALVLKMGPQAFREDATTDFGGIVVKPGEWVIFSIAMPTRFSCVTAGNPTRVFPAGWCRMCSLRAGCPIHP